MTTQPSEMTSVDDLRNEGYDEDLVDEACFGCSTPLAVGVHWHTNVGIMWIGADERPLRLDGPARIDFERTISCHHTLEDDPCPQCFVAAEFWHDDQGRQHRDGGLPAVSVFWTPEALKSREWYRHGNKHRLTGPARESFGPPRDGGPLSDRVEPCVPSTTGPRGITEWRVDGEKVDPARIFAHENELIPLANEDAWNFLVDQANDLWKSLEAGQNDPTIQLALAIHANP